MAVREEKSDTPLQEKLGDLAEHIGKLGTIAAVCMFVVLAVKELVHVYVWETRPLMFQKFLEMFHQGKL